MAEIFDITGQKLLETITTDTIPKKNLGLLRKQAVAMLEKEQKEFLLERHQRTFERLLSKGICFETAGHMLSTLLRDLNLLGFAGMIPEIQEPVELTPEDWYSAMDMVVANHHPEAIDDLNCMNLAGIISANKNEFWAIMINTINGRRRERSLVERSKYLQQERIIGQAIKLEDQKELLEKIDVLQLRLEKANKDRNQKEEEWSQKLNASQKELLAAEASHRKEVKELTDRLNAAEREISILREAWINTNGDYDDDATEEREPAFSEEEIETPDIKLPESGVLFLGGHVNLTNKLKQKYPGWTFLGDEEIALACSDRNVDVCFCWSKHLSHRAQRAVRRNIKESYSIVYVESTNLARLEAEMKSGYAAVKGLIEDAQRHHIQPK